MGARLIRSLVGWLALLLGLATVLAGCGSDTTKLSPRREAELARERTDLVLASVELEHLARPLKAEVKAARQAWPLVEEGFETSVAGGAQAAVARASARAQTIVLPTDFEPESEALTGPASGIAGLMHDFNSLGARGWRLIEQAVRGTGSPASTRFLRENAGLYIDCVYDAHFYLGLIGKKLLSAYEKLGAEEAFGSRLTDARVERIAAIYSPSAFDLVHPPLSLSD